MTSQTPWHKRPKETIPAYEAFTVYLLQGPNRSLSNTGKVLGKRADLMARWSRRHAWQLRVSAYEEHFSLRALDAVEDERITLMREHLLLSSSVLRRARARLEHTVERMPEPTGDSELDARILEELAAQGKLMTVDQALRAADFAVKAGRLATGLDGKYVPAGAGSTDISNLEDEELDRLEALLEKAKK